MKALVPFLLFAFYITPISAQWGPKNTTLHPEPALIGSAAICDGVCAAILVSSLTIDAVKAGRPNNMSLNTTDGSGYATSYDQSNTYFILPPRVIIGASVITYGSILTAVYKNKDDGYHLNRRTYRMGISNIAMGAAAIVIPPLLHLVFMRDGHKKKKKEVEFEMALYMPRPSYTKSVLGLSFATTF